MTAVEQLRAEACDYRTRAVAAGDNGDHESEQAFKVVSIVLYETADALEHELAEAA